MNTNFVKASRLYHSLPTHRGTSGELHAWILDGVKCFCKSKKHIYAVSEHCENVDITSIVEKIVDIPSIVEKIASVGCLVEVWYVLL